MARPAKEYSQAERLLAVYDMLWRGLAIRAPELAETFGVSRRTCERDLAVLQRVLGPRLREERRLDRKVYRIGREYNLGDVSREQVLAYICGAKMVSFLSGPHFQLDAAGLAELLLTGLKNGERIAAARLAERVYITSTGNKDYASQPDKQEVLGEMLDALLFQRAIRISYLSPSRASAGKPPIVINVHPLTLVLHRGGVYFVVECLDDWWRGDRRRLLALDRTSVEHYEATGFREYPDEYDAEAFFADAFGIFSDQEPVEVTLRFAPHYATYVKERSWHPKQSVETEPDGSLVLQFPVSGYAEVSDWILGMGDRVEVVSPPQLREHVADRLRRAAGQYDLE